MTHALVVGGTGMLRNVSLWLAKEGYHVSVIGRSETKLSRLIEQAPTNITALQVDYHNDVELKENLIHTIQKNGPIQLVVSWIHRTAPRALDIIKAEITEPWRLVQVTGSSSNLNELKEKVKPSESCYYQQVQLGFVMEENHSRWLTHEEIADGVRNAIHTKKEVSVVGTVTPWEKRPM